jgi:zinc protease
MVAELETMRKEYLARIEEQLGDPQSMAFTELMQASDPYPKDDLRYQPTAKEAAERLRSVKLDDVANVYKTMWGGSFAELAMVGDFDTSQVKTQLGTLFGDWKSPKPFVRLARPFKKDVAGVEQKIVTPDKQMAFVGVAQNIELRDDDADYPAVEFLNFVMGGSLKSRLIERLRQKEGLSYTAFSSVQADSFEKNGRLLAGAICAPQNAAKAMSALMEEIKLLQAKGVGDAELNDAKKAYELRFQTQLASDDYIVGQLNRSLYVDRTLGFLKGVNDKIQTLSKDDLGKAAQKYVAPARLIRVLAGDLK